MKTAITRLAMLMTTSVVVSTAAWSQYLPPNLQGAQTPAAPASQAAAPGINPSFPGVGPGGQRPGQQQPMPAIPAPPPDLVQMGLEMAAPMSAEQVRELMQELYRRNMATRENFTNRPPARAVTSLHTLDLSPGATPPVVRVAVGQGSVLSFADAAGRPWEIVDNINFNGNAFDVRLIGPHLYTIALREPSAANISIVLKDLPRPIVITAVPAQNEVDYLVEFTVPRFLGGQPPANALVTAADPSAPVFNAQTLLGYLYRTPPRDAVPLRVEGLPGVQAWQSSPNTMVLRTDGMVMLPAWLRRHVSTDGMAVYEVPLSPVVSISQNGQVHRGALSGFVVSTATSAATPSGVANVSQSGSQAGGRP